MSYIELIDRTGSVLRRTSEPEPNFNQKNEIHQLYVVIVFAVRFLQGINWGFSDQMQHESLDKDILLALKVALDIIQSVK